MRRFSNWRVRRRNPLSRIALGGSLLTKPKFFNLRFIWTRTLSFWLPNVSHTFIDSYELVVTAALIWLCVIETVIVGVV
ncbi:MAG: hypothetical protein RLZ28_1047, partial [Actinomycetota bacterium]